MVPADAVKGSPAEGAYTEVWVCPNAANHGGTVECEHCGEQVPGPQFHYSYTPGLLGSGRWNCFPTAAHRAKQDAKFEADWKERIAMREGRSPVVPIELPGEEYTGHDC